MTNQTSPAYERMKASYEMIILWNQLAGKDNKDQETLAMQLERVKEEVDEFLSLKKASSENRSHYRMMMNEACDMFVTAGFLNYLKGGVFPSFDEVKGVNLDFDKSLTKNIEMMTGVNEEIEVKEIVKGFTALAIFIDEFKTELVSKLLKPIVLFDVVGALDAVILSNFSKYVQSDQENAKFITDQTVKRYGKDQIDMTENSGFLIFKRKSDDKVMKPYGYEPADLSGFVW